MFAWTSYGGVLSLCASALFAAMLPPNREPLTERPSNEAAIHVMGIEDIDATYVGEDDGGEDPQGCPRIPPCEQLTRFRAKCKLGIIGRLIVKVKLVPPGPGPDPSVLFGVNGQPFCTPFNRRNVAKLVLENRVGAQFCEVLQPPRCFKPILVNCGP